MTTRIVTTRTMPQAWEQLWSSSPNSKVLSQVGPGPVDTSTSESICAAELESKSRSIARKLLGAGLTKGDRILVSAEPSIEMAGLIVGALRACITVVPFNTAYVSREIEHIVRDCRPKAAAVDNPSRGQLIRDAAISSGFDTCVFNMSIGIEEPPSQFDPDLDTALPGDIALIAYTSGTTGVPKGAMLTHSNLAANALAICETWRWTNEDSLLLSLPMFHGHGLCNGLFGTLMAGSHAFIIPKFDPTVICTLAPVSGATMFFGVPTMYKRLVEHNSVGNLSGLRLCVSGSAALPATLFEQFRAATGHRPLERYGATEILMALSNPFDGERRPGSVGLPLPGVEVKLVQGEVIVRSPMVFSGYLNMPEATEDALSQGWYKTGDLAEISEDGYFTIMGRSKDLIITGGLNVYPREVEEVLGMHPAVREIAVVGEPSAQWGEQVTAYIVADDSYDSGTVLSQSIVEFASTRLAPFKCPKEIRYLDSLPRNALGKVTKHLLG